jgi:CelD/BcsL family acetyltransferase involved in cellulose biosynthesis
MTVVDARKLGASVLADPAADGMIAQVHTVTKLHELEACWRSLETNGLATPYQLFDWSVAWTRSMAGELGLEPLIVAFRDQRGRLLMMLPLCVQRKSGLRIARFLGGKHANMNLPLLERSLAAKLASSDVRKALATVAMRHDIDVFHFENQPLAWDGVSNPILMLPHQPSANSAWKTALMVDPEEMVKSLMSSESRKKLRHKERKLGDLGPVTYREARDAAEALAVLEVFLQQKAQRFSAMGIANPFANESTQAFLRSGVTVGLPERRAPITLHAMRAGDRVLSVFGGAIHHGRYTGMFTSFDADPGVAKYSPGDLLLLNLIRDMCDKGLDVFDLGTGDAAYKNDYCSTEEPLADSFLPFTLSGRAAAVMMTNAIAAKRAMKKSPAMAGLLSRLRKLKRA